MFYSVVKRYEQLKFSLWENIVHDSHDFYSFNKSKASFVICILFFLDVHVL